MTPPNVAARQAEFTAPGGIRFGLVLEACEGILTAVRFRAAVNVDIAGMAASGADADLLHAAAESIADYLRGALPLPIAPLPPARGAMALCREALLSVPPGQTLTYADLARRAGFTSAHARAAAMFCARNPTPFFVPCHRVLPAGGSPARPGGYQGGSALKAALLTGEKSASRTERADSTGPKFTLF